MEFKFLNKSAFKSWEELEPYIKGLPTTKDRGDAFEEFAYLYFKYHNDLYDIKKIYSHDEIPQEYRQKYRLEQQDNGVDGLIITNEDKAIAYQVKFRSDNSSATYSELSTFWAESEYCDERCIFSNCKELPRQSGKKKNQFQILIDTFLTLDSSFFETIYALANANPIPPVQKYSPRPHQDTIIKDVMNGFETNTRGKIICACGTGKTLTALWIKEGLQAKHTLFIVPSLALVKQTLVEWKKQANSSFKHLVVCSDVTVNDGVDPSLESSSTSSIPVTTTSEEIKSFLLAHENDEYVIFSTYQSLDRVAGALLGTQISFDIAFFDEAHRTAGTADSEMFSVGLDDQFIPCSKRLFMTATEKIVSPRIKKLATEREYTIFSMDDERVYGPTFSTLDFGKAIELGIISDYKVLLAAVNSTDIQNLIETGEKMSSNGRTTLDTSTTLKQVILAKAMKDAGIRKAISYHSTVARAQSFVFGASGVMSFEDLLNNVMNFDKYKHYFSHVNGTMSSAERSTIFSEFKSADISLMTNAACLTEGVDIPIIDAVYFVDPKNSIINIIQAIGRALRKSEEKKLEHSYIIIPLIIDDSVNSFQDIDPQSFDTLHMVLQALREQDSRMAEEIDALNYQVATKSTRPSKGISRLGIWVPQNVNLDDFVSSLSLRIADVNKNDSDPSGGKQIQEVEDRHSAVTRVFRTIGDYNIDAYGKVVQPTVDKFEDANLVMPSSLLVINHNNVSHSEKIGVIKPTDKKHYVLTELGKKFKDGAMSFEDLFKRQTLKYFESNANTTSVLFPYRSFLKVLKEFDKISRLEFLYSIYTLKGSTEADVQRGIDIINEIRSAYPNIEILNEENKKKVLELLNLKYGTTFNFADVWTSRTTAYNQFNYFKKHVACYGFIQEENRSDIERTSNSNEQINALLALDQQIETMDIEALKEYYTSVY